MANPRHKPQPVFDTLNETIAFYKQVSQADNPREPIKHWLNHCLHHDSVDVPHYAIKDYHIVLQFLYSYRGSADTFNAYRREMERLLQWSWFVSKCSVLKHHRENIEVFLQFCIKPYRRWIGTKTVARFKSIQGEKFPNPNWHPFNATLSKIDIKAGHISSKKDYHYSQKALKATFAILSSFYQYCLQEELIKSNPIALIRQKSKFIQKEATSPIIRRLSDEQWHMVLHCAKEKAAKDTRYERDVFILSCLYGMYLRISELVASSRWRPTMRDFFKDNDNNWWFKTVGKGNKARQIAVSQSMLQALTHYRTNYLDLPPYPAINEKTPLLGHVKNHQKSMTDSRTLRRIVQRCFDDAINQLEKQSPQSAQELSSATVHWLRHTGISDDVKNRPREHVRDDAGHSSSAITDQYIDVELIERAKSAKYKSIDNIYSQKET